MEKIEAIVLAGGKPGQKPNPFLYVNGRPIVCSALKAVRTCPRISRVILVADTQYVGDDLRGLYDELVPPGNGIVASVQAGVARLTSVLRRCVVICGDQPAVTAKETAQFITSCDERPEVDAIWGFVPSAAAIRACPALGHTYFWCPGEGICCGAGIGMIRPGVEQSPFAKKLETLRKSALGIAVQLLGRVIVEAVRSRRLTKTTVERAVSRLLGHSFAAVRAAGTLSIDIDNEKKWETYVAYLRGR